MAEYPRILGSREQSSMVSTWTEYLRLSKPDTDSALLEICQYEALGERTWDGEGEPVDAPDEIDGKNVVGVEDGMVIGGELQCGNGSFHFTKQTLPDAIEWLGDNWNISDDVCHELAEAVGATTGSTTTESLPKS